MKDNNSKVINGYKAFVKEEDTLFDRYGGKYHEGDLLHACGQVKFHKNGFHFCENLEDTLRYVNAFEDNVVIAKVLGFGKINEYQDDYYEYGKMYACSDLNISKVMSREELLEEVVNKTTNFKRFIEGYNLSLEELYKLLDVSNNRRDVRNTSLIHVIMHNTSLFGEFINTINITDEEISFILRYLPFANISDENKLFIRKCLGEELQKDKIRVRK